MEGKLINYSIINVYDPTEDKEDDEKEAFYGELENWIQVCCKNNIIIIVGDLNAKLDKSGIDANYS